MLDIIKASNLTRLGDNPPPGGGAAPGWSFFIETIDHVRTFRSRKQTAQPYDTYVGFQSGEEGIRFTLQASVKAFIVLFVCLVVFLAASGGSNVIDTLAKALAGGQ
jgi:hypothetical protein